MNSVQYKSQKHNIAVNLGDGAFFGMAMGFASFVTVLPLFVSTMTGSAILIGLIPAIHTAGWQLPQLFTARRVAQQSRILPILLWWTCLERLPFLGLAVVAWFLPLLGVRITLILTFIMLIWQGLGGGLAANPWQSLIGKIIPGRIRGTFFGVQGAVAGLLSAIAAVLAGFILERQNTPLDYTLCFLFAFGALLVSWVFLALTREPETPVEYPSETRAIFWSATWEILRKDHNFRRFLVARMLSQLALMSIAFYTVYAVNYHGMSPLGAGWMTGVLMTTEILANLVMGWLGDRWSHKAVMEIGLVAGVFSALIAWQAPNSSWFFLVFILAGIAIVTNWTIGITMTLEFGLESQRPAYIGMANTLIAPVNIIAPFFGGWLADQFGYPAAFIASAVGGIIAFLFYLFLVVDPKRRNRHLGESVAAD